MPTPNPVGSPGWFAHGVPNVTPYTVLTADWGNAVQAELMNVISAAGLSLDKTDQTQLLTALTLLHGMQVFAASGTFTVPAYVNRVQVIVTGGGAASGHAAALRGAAGGGAGGTAIKYCTVTPGASIAVTVGAAGTGTSGAGNNGGTSSFGSFCSATGGIGGATSSGSFSAGGYGGIGVGGDLNMLGGWGDDGETLTPPGYCFGGGGGASYWGGALRGGTAQPPESPTATHNSGAPGSGAGGPYDIGLGAVNGRMGNDGIVVISW